MVSKDAVRLPSLTGVALVTGGASGIGKETGYTFAESGCRAVIFADLDHSGASNVSQESRSYAANEDYQTLAIEVDTTNPESVQRMVETVVKEFGRIDCSVNAAGISETTLALTAYTEFSTYSRIIDTNLKGTFNTLRAVAAAMSSQSPLSFESTNPRFPKSTRSLGRGCIVNLGSVYSHMADMGIASYVSSKHGVVGLTKAAALDHARDGIRVNAVCPGPVDTPMTRRAFESNMFPQDAVEKSAILTQRVAAVEEVVGAVLFLCSPAASYMTGSIVDIDSGLSLSSSRY